MFIQYTVTHGLMMYAMTYAHAQTDTHANGHMRWLPTLALTLIMVSMPLTGKLKEAVTRKN